MENELFINKKQIPSLGLKCKTYMNHNGVMKEIKLSILTSKIVNPNQIWYKLNDLPLNLQEVLKDKALTIDEIREYYNRTIRKQEFVDKENVRIYVTDRTEIMPIVGNLLPQDGVSAYTVVVKEKNNQVTLKPIPILSGCHWSELFTGITKYGNNVFCLAADLTLKQREDFKDEIIELRDALDFLENNNTKKLS